jgi:allophanate hydrolase
MIRAPGVAALLEAYASGATRPVERMAALLDDIDRAPERHVWITRLSREAVLARARDVESRPQAEQPLYGIPFVIKDNIDLAGVPTTAGCPARAYTPQRSATVVERLLAAGAIPLGKTNLDQLATGLVGTRSPYGACRNAFSDLHISGGSSSGSAVAVASGLAAFALGTDTAGSGRVPAGFNNILGLKPTRGRLSTRGVVPACRTLDCVSIFALDAADAARVLAVAEGADAEDPLSRELATQARPRLGASFRVAVPRPAQREFCGDIDYERLFEVALARLESLGASLVEIDFAPFQAVARLLYDGPWLAERYVVAEKLLVTDPDALLPVTRAIIAAGAGPSAADAFRAQYRLLELETAARRALAGVDLLVTPTAPTLPRLIDEQRDPVRLNASLGCYTNFVNLLDLAAVAVPSGFRPDRLPFGITLVGPAGTDRRLLDLAARYHAATGLAPGATGRTEPTRPAEITGPGVASIVVCGAHLDGLPLNHQLQERGGVLRRRTRTTPDYRLYALPGGPPQRPGLVRVNDGGGAVEVEVWDLPLAGFGSLVAGIQAPLGIGRVRLEDGGDAPGFLCEAAAVAGALDITSHGGWRAWLATGA